MGRADSIRLLANYEQIQLDLDETAGRQRLIDQRIVRGSWGGPGNLARVQEAIRMVFQGIAKQ